MAATRSKTKAPEAEPETVLAVNADDWYIEVGNGVNIPILAKSEYGVMTEVGWVPVEGLDLDGWSVEGQRIGRFGRAIAWCGGDWLLYAEEQMNDDRYTQFIEATGYDYGTVTNWVSVARAWPISRRREDVAWSVHQTLAALHQDQQEYWIERVRNEKMTRAQLREALKEAGLLVSPEQPAWTATVKKEPAPTCGRCGTECFKCVPRGDPKELEAILGDSSED